MSNIEQYIGWIPKKINQTENRGAMYSVEPSRWNELWNLSIAQGDYNSDTIKQVITATDADINLLQSQITTNLGLLQTHQGSADHDSRYYTEAETDAFLSALKGAGYTNQTLKGLSDVDASLQSQITNIIATFSTDAERIAAFQDVVNQFQAADANIINLINGKASTTDVYTKAQTDAKVWDTANIADNAITSAKIPTDAIKAQHIEAGAVGAAELHPSLLENVLIAQHRNVNPMDHPDSSVMSKHIRTKAVTTDKVADKAITVAQLGDDVLAVDTPYTTTFNSNTYSITTRAGYVSGNPLAFVASADSTGAVSLSVDGVVSPLLKANGGAVANLKNNGLYTARKNGSNFTLQGEGGEYGTATPAETLSGYTVGTESGLQNGTLTLTGNATDSIVVNGYTYYNNNAKVKRTGALIDRPYAQTASGLWTDGNGTLALSMPVGAYRQEGAMGAGLSCISITDIDFVAANIKAGKEILGVIGTLPDGTNKRKYASGEGYFSSFLVGSNYYVRVSGFDFTPSFGRMMIYQSGYPYEYLLTKPQSSPFAVSSGSYLTDIKGFSTGTGNIRTFCGQVYPNKVEYGKMDFWAESNFQSIYFRWEVWE